MKDNVLVLVVLYQMCKSVLCSTLCKPDQLMRTNSSGNYICCYTVVCQKGQKYDFCDIDQGHDTCTNCPNGMYHLDTINTAYMNSILDPCVPKPTCDQPEVKLEDERCVCDRSRGYFGNDVNNCLLAEVTCDGPGFELKNNGRCEACGEEYFKPEGSGKSLCIPKTRCFESQEIENNGSTTEDRTCRAKKYSPRTTPESMVNQNYSKNFTLLEDNESDSNTSVVAGVIGGLVAVITIAILSIVCHRHRRRTYKYVTAIKNKLAFDDSPEMQYTEHLYDPLHFYNRDNENLNDDITSVKLLDRTSRHGSDDSISGHSVQQGDIFIVQGKQNLQNVAILHSPKQRHDIVLSSCSEEFAASCSVEETFSGSSSKTYKSINIEPNSVNINTIDFTLPSNLESGGNSIILPMTKEMGKSSETNIKQSVGTNEYRVEGDDAPIIKHDVEALISSKPGYSRTKMSPINDKKLFSTSKNIDLKPYHTDKTTDRYFDNMPLSNSEIPVSSNKKSYQHTRQEKKSFQSANDYIQEHSMITTVDEERNIRLKEGSNNTIPVSANRKSDYQARQDKIPFQSSSNDIQESDMITRVEKERNITINEESNNEMPVSAKRKSDQRTRQEKNSSQSSNDYIPEPNMIKKAEKERSININEDEHLITGNQNEHLERRHQSEYMEIRNRSDNLTKRNQNEHDIKARNKSEHLKNNDESRQRCLKKGQHENKTGPSNDHKDNPSKERHPKRQVTENCPENNDDKGCNTYRNGNMSDKTMQWTLHERGNKTSKKYTTRKSDTKIPILVLRTETKDNTESQTSPEKGLFVLEDESIPDPADLEQLDYLRHVYKRSNYEDGQNKIKFEDIKESKCRVAKVSPRIKETENNDDNIWRTQDQNLPIAQPEIIDDYIKVATSISNRPLDPQLNNSIRVAENNSGQESESSASELTEFPPADSVDFDTNQTD